MWIFHSFIGLLLISPVFSGKEFLVATICDGESGTLSCKDGNVISLVWASYGRVHPDTCTEEGQMINTTCRADVDEIMTQISESCVDVQSCTLQASSDIFNAPAECEGIKKYLQVYYLCKSPPIFATVCEFEPPKNISCPKEEDSIDIEYARYGRQRRTKCGKELADNTNCISKTSDAIVKKNCNGKRYCLLEADNAAMGGNPCGITHKYLAVQFFCVSGQPEGTIVEKKGHVFSSFN